MRRIMLLLLIIFLCTPTYGNRKVDQTQTLAVSLVLDVSPTMKRHASTIKAMEHQIFSGLKRLDYIELISAHHQTGALRLAQFIQTGTTEEVKSLSNIAGNIKYADWLDSDVSAAFKLAYDRLDEMSKTWNFGKHIIIILTDGNLKDREAKRIVFTASKCRQRGWVVYITGTQSSTNRYILTTAASKGDLHWSPLDTAYPAVWIADIRNTLPPKDPSPDKKPSKEATKPNPLPEQTPPGQKIPLETKTIKTKDPPPTIIPQVKPKQRPEKQKGTVKPGPDSAETKPSKSAKSIWAWLGLLLILIVTILGVIFWKKIKEFENWLKKIRPPKIHRRKNNEVLTARYNGRIFRLGRLARLRKIHIGSTPRNTLRIQEEETVADRHVCIYRKRGQLMLRNLAQTPIMIEQNQIKSGHKHPLRLPVTVRLSDTVALHLDLDRTTSVRADLEEEV